MLSSFSRPVDSLSDSAESDNCGAFDGAYLSVSPESDNCGAFDGAYLSVSPESDILNGR